MARIMEWNENGTISMRSNPIMKSVIIESAFLTDIFERIEGYMGIQIGHIVFEAQRNTALKALDIQLSRPIFRIGKKGKFKHVGGLINSRIPVWTGQAYTKLLNYKPGREAEILVKNPYNRELMAAIILGEFESLEGRPFSHRWERMGEEEIIILSVMDGKPEIAERLNIEFPPEKPGIRRIERCISCNAPAGLGYLEWREDEGMVIDSRRNTRVTFLDAFVPTIVFRELEKELGEVVYDLLLHAEKEYSKARTEEIAGELPEHGALTDRMRDDIYKKTLEDMPLWGLGNPVRCNHESGWLEVAIDNPYNEYLLAGKMAGVFETIERSPSVVEWKLPDPSSIIFTVKKP